MGSNVRGLLMYTPDGYMCSHIQTPGQPNFASADLNGGTEAELAEAARRHFGYTGPFYIDESGEEVVLKHHLSISTFPNWAGGVQVRIARMEGDKLVLRPEQYNQVLVCTS
jgi:Lipocalin-like domain